MVVEYCRHGNLQSYLKKYQDRYISQVDSAGNLLPVNVTMNEASHRSDIVNSPNKYLIYINFHFYPATFVVLFVLC